MLNFLRRGRVDVDVDGGRIRARNADSKSLAGRKDGGIANMKSNEDA
jgi:hypothetical protein